MRRRDITTAFLSSATTAAMLPRIAQAQSCTAPCYPQTAAEIAVGVVPMNTAYVPGHVYRYGTNTHPGSTDMTPAITTAANVCRQGNYPLQLPGETMLVWNSLDFSKIYVTGLGSPFGGASLIQAPLPSATPPTPPPGYVYPNPPVFDVVTTTGESTFYNFNVDGANPLNTATNPPTPQCFQNLPTNLIGNNFALLGGSNGPPYLVSFIHVGSTNAKRSLCYIKNGGYTSFFHFHGVNAGLHGLECDTCTTIRDYGGSQFGGTASATGGNCMTIGYGILLTNCGSCAFHDTILEYTGGIQLNGVSNRALTFDGVYQEHTSPTQFITDGTPGVKGPKSSGIGLIVRGCFGGNTTISFLQNWQDVYFEGNSNLDSGAVPFANRIMQNDGGEQFVSATSDVTAASFSLNPGTYLVFGTVQSIINAGTGNVAQLACNITTNPSGSGLANSTNSASFSPGADEQTYNPASGISDLRVNSFTILQLQSATTVYLNTHIAINGSATIAYHGFLNAVLFQ
jgi:hypothetical protein